MAKKGKRGKCKGCDGPVSGGGDSHAKSTCPPPPGKGAAARARWRTRGRSDEDPRLAGSESGPVVGIFMLD